MADEPTADVLLETNTSQISGITSRRKYSSGIKSVLHFNYPYYAEPNDGLEDDILGYVWTRSNSGVKLVGSEIPADQIISGTPKFGYRCLSTSGNYISAPEQSPIVWGDPTGLGERELSMWVRPTSSDSGALFTLMNGTDEKLKIMKNGSNQLSINNGSRTYTSTSAMSLNTWHYIKVSLNSEGGAGAYLDGNNVIATPDFSHDMTVTEARIGGFTGQIDEFCWSHSITAFSDDTDTIGGEISGWLNFDDIGGQGTGQHGNVTFNADVVINSYARLTSVTGKTFNTGSWTNGRIGAVTAGSEVMIHVTSSTGTNQKYTGCYAFRTVTAVNGTTLIVDSEITDEFPLQAIISSSVIQVITVPNFNTLTLNAGKKITPLTYNESTGGGIIVFRSKGNVTINGYVVSSGYGPTRTDLLQLTHAKIIDNFVVNRGGGIMMFCGATITAPSSGRIGATWSGAGTGGGRDSYRNPLPGGAGYGAAGDRDTDNGGTGGLGGVGGGGGGGDGYVGGDAGTAGTGGYGIDLGRATSQGGTQGRTPGGNSPDTTGDLETGGGGAGGNAGTTTGGAGTVYGGVSGANVIIVSKAVNINAAALSTGGGVATGRAGNTAGGGGTGFCYIAVE